jgi:hypothetical protein
MKVAAAVGICCLIIVTVVNGAVFRVAPIVSEVDGELQIHCSIEWGDGITYTINIGEEVQLPSVNGGYCHHCVCDGSGMDCAQLYSESPGCPGLKYNTDENGNIWAVGK